MARTVVVQLWEESERGWGVRPDGYSLHLSESDRAAYIKAYWDSMPDAVPDEYERPAGSPYLADVDAESYRTLRDSENGIRIYSKPAPRKL